MMKIRKRQPKNQQEVIQEPIERRTRVVRRRKTTQPIAVEKTEEEIQSANLSLKGFLDHGKAPLLVTRKRETLKPLEALLKDAEIRCSNGDWSNANGKVFVGLYLFCFQMVYSEMPAGLGSGVVGIYSRIASAALRNHFDNDASSMVEFVKWTWEREEGRKQWAIRNGIDKKPLNLRFQFSDILIQEFRLNRANHGNRRR